MFVFVGVVFDFDVDVFDFVVSPVFDFVVDVFAFVVVFDFVVSPRRRLRRIPARRLRRVPVRLDRQLVGWLLLRASARPLDFDGLIDLSYDVARSSFDVKSSYPARRSVSSAFMPRFIFLSNGVVPIFVPATSTSAPGGSDLDHEGDHPVVHGQAAAPAPA